MFDGPTILMCPPDFYGIEYEINPWMSRSRQSDHGESIRQWNDLRDLLVSLGVDVRTMEPVRGLPDLVFTANAGLVWHDRVYLSRFRHAARQGETPLDADWFREQGFDVRQVAGNAAFEGAGDALFCGETLFAGYVIRSDVAAVQSLAAELGCPAIPLELVSGYHYHLDTCFCPLDPTTALWYPAAFDEYGRKAIEDRIESLIAVDEADARRFACNAVVVGRHVVLNTRCESTEAALRTHGFEPRATPLDEFLKAGGSAKCLTLRLDGEEAAVWGNVGDP